MSIGQRNVYTCEMCHRAIVTIDVDAGVTPMFIGCRATPGCEGRMASGFYRVDPEAEAIRDPEWEWYRPTPREAKRMGREMAEHVRRGGLNLRRVAVIRNKAPANTPGE